MAKVLLIDDDAAILGMLSAFLGRKGWTTVKASNATEGLSLAQSEAPDIILCDVQLPDKSGFEVGRALHGDPALSGIPLILISGNKKDADDIENGLALGAQGYILKPVDLRLVDAKLKAVLEGCAK